MHERITQYERQMPIIRFIKNLPEIQVESGAVLMKSLIAAGLPVASSCHGDGVCSKCRVRVVEGVENLSKIGDLEQTLRDRNRLSPEYRISCQTHVLGDVTVDTGYW